MSKFSQVYKTYTFSDPLPLQKVYTSANFQYLHISFQGTVALFMAAIHRIVKCTHTGFYKAPGIGLCKLYWSFHLILTITCYHSGLKGHHLKSSWCVDLSLWLVLCNTTVTVNVSLIRYCLKNSSSKIGKNLYYVSLVYKWMYCA